MTAISLDSHVELANRIVELRAERNRVASELKKAEGTLRGIMGDATVATLGGEPLFQVSQGPDKDETDVNALIASLSPRTVAKFAVTVPGRKSLQLAKDAEGILSRFWIRKVA